MNNQTQYITNILFYKKKRYLKRLKSSIATQIAFSVSILRGYRGQIKCSKNYGIKG